MIVIGAAATVVVITAICCDNGTVFKIVGDLLVKIALYLALDRSLTEIKLGLLCFNFASDSLGIVLGRWGYQTARIADCAGVASAAVFWCVWSFERDPFLGVATGITDS